MQQAVTMTGNGRNPVSEPGIAAMVGEGLGHNRGGRPRKDGLSADACPRWAEAGFSKRDAARVRALSRLTDEEFEDAMTAFRAEWKRTGRKPSIERFLTERGDNTRLERETDASMARLASTLRRIERDYKFDASQTGEAMRSFVAMTRQTWREWGLSLSAKLSAILEPAEQGKASQAISTQTMSHDAP
jgi:hypothetical protein